MTIKIVAQTTFIFKRTERREEGRCERNEKFMLRVAPLCIKYKNIIFAVFSARSDVDEMKCEQDMHTHKKQQRCRQQKKQDVESEN
jgi:hypothetical protein